MSEPSSITLLSSHCSAVLTDVLSFATPAFLLWTLLALALDALIGDPVFNWHPIRLLGRLLTTYENLLFRLSLNNHLGGILLFVALTATVLPFSLLLLTLAHAAHPIAYHATAAILLWACFALRDLITHSERVARALARDDLPAARTAISMLVGRDTHRMDSPACARAAIESTSENLVDGVHSPLLYALLFGPLGAITYKIISTMDSMVGYKNDRYLRFGWCGARLDDLANFLPARLSWLLLSFLAVILPGYHARRALATGLAQHARIPGPNSGWPEATTAGALNLRLIGPIYKNDQLVADLWLGPTDAPTAATPRDIRRTYPLLLLSTALLLLPFLLRHFSALVPISAH